jgi:beta-glucosidase
MLSILTGLEEARPHPLIDYLPGEGNESVDERGKSPACEKARAFVLVILCLGEARWMWGEAGCRACPGLPGCQEELARAVLDCGVPVVVLLCSGRPLLVPWLFERAAAVVATWYLGSEAGRAIADVLTGRCNPSGRLPVSWPVDVGQVPVFYSRLPTGRPIDPTFRYSSKYLDMPNEPLFPFGHGLSYTQFSYHDLRASPTELVGGDTLTVEVDVANDGPAPGEETVLLFIRDPVASVSRPVLELKAMTKLSLIPGDRVTARLTLPSSDLAFVGPDLAPRLERGAFQIFVGPTADPGRLLMTEVTLLTS